MKVCETCLRAFIFYELSGEGFTQDTSVMKTQIVIEKIVYR